MILRSGAVVKEDSHVKKPVIGRLKFGFSKITFGQSPIML
jgi:hypothetical protein